MAGRTPHVAVVVGNPKPRSRTLAAALHVATELSGSDPTTVIDLAALGPALLDWEDPTIAGLVDRVGSADLVVVACPTYKGTYTGLLKLFLDRFDTGALTGVAVPLMLGAGPRHALSPELTLRPVLVELGATVPMPGLYVIDSSYSDPSAYAAWLNRARPAVTAILDHPHATSGVS
jgi:FMN reductase